MRSIPEIESINLERNAIKSIHPQAFCGAKQLMLLNLYSNRITNLPPRGFQVKGLERNRLHVQQSHCNNLITKFFHVCRICWTFASSCLDRTRLASSMLRCLLAWGTCQISISLWTHWPRFRQIPSSLWSPSKFWIFPWISFRGSLLWLSQGSDSSCFSTWTITGHNNICPFTWLYYI